MTRSVKRAVIATSYGIAMLVALLSPAMAPIPAVAQVAGGSQHGVGAPLGVDGALLVRPGPIEPPRCIHRAIDLRRSSNLDDNRLTEWVTVHLPALAVINASGTASGARIGTIAISVISDGVPIASSPVNQGADFIQATTSGRVSLIPGRQYKFTAKALVTDKRLDLFSMDVGVGKTCP